MILPTLMQWAEELEGKVEIVKFNCNKHNKDLGISVRPRPSPYITWDVLVCGLCWSWTARLAPDLQPAAWIAAASG